MKFSKKGKKVVLSPQKYSKRTANILNKNTMLGDDIDSFLRTLTHAFTFTWFILLVTQQTVP